MSLAAAALLHAVDRCRATSCRLTLLPHPPLDYTGIYTEGESIDVCLASSRWEITLVHEVCHLDQYTEGSELWEQDTFDLDSWVDGKRYRKETVRKGIWNKILLEQDCEYRTNQKIMAWGYPEEAAGHRRKANVYMLFYVYSYLTRTWNYQAYDRATDHPDIPKEFLSFTTLEELLLLYSQYSYIFETPA